MGTGCRLDWAAECMCVCMHVCMCVRACLYVCMHVYMCIYVCVCMYVCICMRTMAGIQMYSAYAVRSKYRDALAAGYSRHGRGFLG